MTVSFDSSGEDPQPQLTRLKESQTVVVLRLPSHRLTLAARMGFPFIVAEPDRSMIRGEDQLALGEEYRSGIETLRRGVAGEDIAVFKLLCFVEPTLLGSLDKKEALFRGFGRRSGLEVWGIV